MKTAKGRRRIGFAGMEFSGVVHSETHITVPLPALMKLLRARAVAPHCCYDIEHDGDGRNDRYHFDIQRVAQWCDRELKMLRASIRRPWLLYFDGQVIHYCPHSNLSYELQPATPPAATPDQLGDGGAGSENGSPEAGSNMLPSASRANVSAVGNVLLPTRHGRVQTSH